MSHRPVLLHEVIKFLGPKTGEFIIDGTVDGGGHGAEIFERISPNGILLGVDWDEGMIELAEERISARSKFKNPRSGASSLQGRQESKLILVHGNYADLPKLQREENLGKADGLLLDLGFSSEQLEIRRGFSFEKESPLIMTYDESRKPVREILEDISEEELATIISTYGGEKYSRRIARAIKKTEKLRPIYTTRELAQVIVAAVPRGYERGRIHPATRTFQALRIYANDELGNLRKLLSELENILKPNGRIVIISLHSLEDRIVKQKFAEFEKLGEIKVLTKKPVTATEEEIKENPRSRSAKLRAAVITRK